MKSRTDGSRRRIEPIKMKVCSACMHSSSSSTQIPCADPAHITVRSRTIIINYNYISFVKHKLSPNWHFACVPCLRVPINYTHQHRSGVCISYSNICAVHVCVCVWYVHTILHHIWVSAPQICRKKKKKENKNKVHGGGLMAHTNLWAKWMRVDKCAAAAVSDAAAAAGASMLIAHMCVCVHSCLLNYYARYTDIIIIIIIIITT